MKVFMYIFVFILGTVLASFVHLYVTRMLRKESVVKPRSHCDNCHHVLSWYELIPIFSYIALKGKCKSCSKKIGVSSLLAEIFTGICFVLVYGVYGLSYKTLLGFVLVLVTLSIFLSDFKEMIILDSTLICGLILELTFIYLDLGVWKGLYKSILYGIFAFVFMFIIKILGDALFKKESLGGGDIKLAFLMGLALPYDLFFVAIVIGSFCALPYALYVSISKKSHELAYGPFLALGMFITFLARAPIQEMLLILIK